MFDCPIPKQRLTFYPTSDQRSKLFALPFSNKENREFYFILSFSVDTFRFCFSKTKGKGSLFIRKMEFYLGGATE